MLHSLCWITGKGQATTKPRLIIHRVSVSRDKHLQFHSTTLPICFNHICSVYFKDSTLSLLWTTYFLFELCSPRAANKITANQPSHICVVLRKLLCARCLIKECDVAGKIRPAVCLDNWVWLPALNITGRSGESTFLYCVRDLSHFTWSLGWTNQVKLFVVTSFLVIMTV